MFGQTKDLVEWGYMHPYLFTIIQLGQPSVYAVILFAGSKIISNVLRMKRR